MADRHINIKLGTKFNGGGISSALRSLKNLVRGATDIKSAFGMVAGTISKAFSAIKGIVGSAFKFETQTTQFKTLIGDIDEAKAHMADLKALGDTPPFNLDQFAAASKSLMVMTDGALGYKKSLELIGDAAAATGQPIEEMGHAVGRLFAIIRDGQPISRATMQLRNMGVITPEVAAKLDEMQKAGRSTAEIWGEVEAALGRYSGAMKETEQTGEGLIGAIKSQWDNVVRSFGDAFSDTAKDGMGSLLDKMKELEKDGSVGTWAEKAVEAFTRVADGAKAILGPLSQLAGGAWSAIKGNYESISKGLGGFFGSLAGGGSVGDALKEGWGGYKQGWIDAFDLDGAEAAKDERRRAEQVKKIAEKKAKEEAEAAKKAEEEQRRIQESLAEGQRKIDERNAAEKAKKEVEAQKKVAAEIEKLQREREKLEEQAHQKRMADLRAEIELQKKAAEPLKATISAAQSEFDKAFAMYRDPERAAAQIAEERDYAADLKQLRKDASRYSGKWRIDELSQLMAAGDTQGVQTRLEEWRKSRRFTPEVEAMVRASAADQTKTTAEDELRRLNEKTGKLTEDLERLSQSRDGKLSAIEKNTNQLAEKIDALLSVKG